MTFPKRYPHGKCPLCGTEDSYEGTDFGWDDTEMWQKYECSECGAFWTEYYKLTYDGAVVHNEDDTAAAEYNANDEMIMFDSSSINDVMWKEDIDGNEEQKS